MSPNEILIVDSRAGIKDMIDDIQDLPTSPPSLYLDLEGIDLSRDGTIALLQLFVSPKSKVYIVDVYRLGTIAFYTPGSDNITSFRSILCSPDIPKVFFDCRNDSDALHEHTGTVLQGVIDVQVMESLSRPGKEHHMNFKGLANCIERDCALTPMQQLACLFVKMQGKNLFLSRLGGQWEVLNERPIRHAIIDYCTVDVVYLPELWKKYDEKLLTLQTEILGENRVQMAEIETKKRLWDSIQKVPLPNGPDRAISPWASEKTRRKNKKKKSKTAKLAEAKAKAEEAEAEAEAEDMAEAEELAEYD